MRHLHHARMSRVTPGRPVVGPAADLPPPRFRWGWLLVVGLVILTCPSAGPAQSRGGPPGGGFDPGPLFDRLAQGKPYLLPRSLANWASASPRSAGKSVSRR